MKRVLLIVVDGCTSRLMRPALEAGRLPTFARLLEYGVVGWDCVSIFPSITPAATASIVTGRYPCDHGIAGMSWWNPQTGDVSYFGDDIWTMLNRGPAEFVQAFLQQLNGERLRMPTLFQTVERHGLSAGCINHLIFRGDVPHDVNVPLLLRLWPTMPSSLQVYGPSLLALGDFVSDRPSGADLDADGGITGRFGMDDDGTADFLKSLPNARALPDFTVAYFADYDFESHDRGPETSLDTLRRLDRRLADIFDAWGGTERVLDELCVMVTADHSHSEVGDQGPAGIAIDDLLSDFAVANPNTGWSDGEELMVCPNMRATEILVHEARRETIERVCAALLQEERVDQVIWREPESDGIQISVATRDRGRLRFSAARDGEPDARDGFGGGWRIQGDLSAVDARLDVGTLEYGDYPNALERIEAGVAHPRGGRLWATARPGYEFQMAGQSVHHRAGSHATLHALDSLVPLLVAGAPRGLRVPSPARIVDAAPLCLSALELPVEIEAGASHASGPAGRRTGRP